MSKLKTYCYSTFSNTYNKSSKTDLLVNNSENIKTNIYRIESWGNYCDALKYILDENICNFLYENYKEIIDNIYQIIPYEYFDINNNCYTIRNFILTIDFKLYEIIDLDLVFKLSFENEYPKIIFNENDLYLIKQSGEYVLFETDSEAIVGSTLPYLKYTYTNEHILFSSNNPLEIYYTEKIPIKDISKNLIQYNKITLPYSTGKILTIVNTYNKLFAVCQYGIHVIDSSSFSIQQTLETSFEIFENAINYTEDYIVFYSSSGLFTFDKNNLKQLFSNEDIDLKNAKSFIFNNKYYLFEADLCGFVYEINLNNHNITKLKFNNLINIYLLSNSKFYNLVLNLNNNSNYHNITICNADNNTFKSKLLIDQINFDSLYQKQIKSLKIYGEGEFDIEITSDISTYKTTCNGDALLYNINILGSYFIISISSSHSFKINSFIFEVLNLEE